MKKKILVISIVAVFMLVAISFASAVNTTTTSEKKESPLFGIRTRRAIGERLGELKENIKARFIGERIFFLPFTWLSHGQELSAREQLRLKDWSVQIVCTRSFCTSGLPTSCAEICS